MKLTELDSFVIPIKLKIYENALKVIDEDEAD